MSQPDDTPKHAAPDNEHSNVAEIIEEAGGRAAAHDDAAVPAHAQGDAPRRRNGIRVIAGAIVVVLAWLVVGGLAGPLFGELSSKQTNDSAAFLPADAEATRAAALQRTFAETNSIPAIVLYTTKDGSKLTQAQLGAIAQDGQKFAGTASLASAPIGPIPSQDGEAAQIIVPFKAAAGNEIGTLVGDLRSAATATGRANDLTTHVTGFGGILADLTSAFAGIDGKLIVTAGIVVIVILLVVYRSPVLWLAPIVGAGLSLAVAVGVITLLVDNDVIKLNGQSQGILYVLVFGASTDYALLLISRYREELHRHQRPFDAMRVAYRGSAPAILASGATVTVGLLCLLFSQLNSNRSLGPVGAAGIVAAMAVMLTFLPAVLVLTGRAIFWPFMPKFDAQVDTEHGWWGRLSRWLGSRARVSWIVATVVLIALGSLVTTLKADGISQTETFTTRTDAVVGQDVLLKHFPGGVGSPTTVFVSEAKAAQVKAAVAKIDGVEAVAYYTGQTTNPSAPSAAPKVVNGRVQLDATLESAPDSLAAETVVTDIRSAAHDLDGSSLVGGLTATQLDTRAASRADQKLIIPIVLLVIVVILGLLLRAVLAPILLVLTVVLSFFATLGVCAFAFNHIFDFPGADPSIVLFAFVFLVALGIDYNIFLMTRVREESLRHGTRPGVTKGLAVTGGVITSAGVVLAATFAVLGVLPLVFLAQIGFAVAFGVLLDTLLVRSVLVPALVHDIGPAVWWPSALAKRPDDEEVEPATDRDVAPVG